MLARSGTSPTFPPFQLMTQQQQQPHHSRHYPSHVLTWPVSQRLASRPWESLPPPQHLRLPLCGPQRSQAPPPAYPWPCNQQQCMQTGGLHHWQPVPTSQQQAPPQEQQGPQALAQQQQGDRRGRQGGLLFRPCQCLLCAPLVCVCPRPGTLQLGQQQEGRVLLVGLPARCMAQHQHQRQHRPCRRMRCTGPPCSM